jgi:hypothetical protein
MGAYADVWEYTDTLYGPTIIDLVKQGWEPYAVSVQDIYLGSMPPTSSTVVHHLKRRTGRRVRVADE